jgi:hypothetical protein
VPSKRIVLPVITWQAALSRQQGYVWHRAGSDPGQHPDKVTQEKIDVVKSRLNRNYGHNDPAGVLQTHKSDFAIAKLPFRGSQQVRYADVGTQF